MLGHLDMCHLKRSAKRFFLQNISQAPVLHQLKVQITKCYYSGQWEDLPSDIELQPLHLLLEEKEKLPYHITSSAETCNILDYSTAVPQWQININKLEVEVNNNAISEHATPVSMKHNHIF